MTARLPTPGPVDQWGQDFLDWLLVARNADGSLNGDAARTAIGGSITAPVGEDIVFSTGESDPLTERARIAADGTISGLADAAQTPTISDLVAGVTRATQITASDSMPVFIAPFACKVVAASFIPWNTSIAASDTNYWTVEVRRFRANISAIIATKTTKATGGAAISQRTDWNFDAVTFDASNQVLQKGDSVDFAFIPTGAPGSFQVYCIAQIRYEPI